MCARILFLAALLWSVTAVAQPVTVIGPITPGHLPAFNSPTTLKDSGFSPGGFPITVGDPVVGGTNNCLFYDAANFLGCLATANSGVLVTNGSGVPSISSTLPSGLAIPGYALLAGGNTFTGSQIFDITGTPPNGFQVRTNDGGTTAASIAAINYAGTGSGSSGGAFHGECIGGSFAAQTQCKSGWMISGFGGIVHTGVGLSASSPSSMIYTADEDQTPTANGSHIDWFTTPIGTALLNRVNWMTLTNNGVLQIKSTGTIKVGDGTADANSGALIQAVVTSGGVASLISQPNSITGFNGLHVNNSAVNVGLFAVVIEPSSTATNFGVANANWTEIVSSGASNNGFLFGTLSNTPIVFGTNNTERMRLLAGLAVGLTTDPGAGIVSAVTGFRVNNAAASGNVLRGNGTNFVSALLACADLSVPCITGNQTIALSGDVTGSGTTAITTVLATAQPAVHTWALDQTYTTTLVAPNIASDAGLTDTTLCWKNSATTGTFLKGSGTLGICLGTSGAQFKTAFAPMAAGIEEISRLNLINYRYRDGFGDSGERVQYGMTAQDVAEVMPDLVRYDERGVAVNFDIGAFLPISLRAIQQLDKRLAKLESGK